MEAKNLIFGTGASSSKDHKGLAPVVEAAVRNGILRFDTAPSYRTEAVLGTVLREVLHTAGLSRSDVSVQTKIDAWQMQASGGDVERYVKETLGKMGLKYFDSLLIHWPLPEYLESTWKSFVRMRQAGLVRQIGICNLRMRQLEQIAGWEHRPQIVQLERNPLRVCQKEIAFCAEHGIAVQAYSPLCKMDPRIRDSRVIADLAEKYGKNVGQIVMRWHLDTGVTPVFTSTKQSRVGEYADIFDFCLTDEELTMIFGLNENYKMYLESWACPGF